MAELTEYLENALLNHVFRNSALSSPTTVYGSLHTATSSDTSAGTEVSTTDTGYARQAVAFAAPSAGVIANSAEETFGNTGATNFGTVVSFGIYDALTVGNQLAFDNDLVDTAVATNDEVKFAATTGITITLV